MDIFSLGDARSLAITGVAVGVGLGVAVGLGVGALVAALVGAGVDGAIVAVGAIGCGRALLAPVWTGRWLPRRALAWAYPWLRHRPQATISRTKTISAPHKGKYPPMPRPLRFVHVALPP